MYRRSIIYPKRTMGDNKFDKDKIKRLSELARIELKEEEAESLAGDINQILDYIEELGELDTENVEPMAGGVIHKNIWREDGDPNPLSGERSVRAFPEEKDGFLRTPPVFE